MKFIDAIKRIFEAAKLRQRCIDKYGADKLRQRCIDKYGADFALLYDSAAEGKPIGDLEQTLIFLHMVDTVRKDLK